MTGRGWRGRRLGLRGRIAWGVFAAVLVTSAAASTVAFVHLSHTATEQFHDQARRQAQSDVFGASSSAQLSVGAGAGGNPADAPLSTVFTATFQNFFLPDKTYAVVVMKPGPNGTYSFPSAGTRDGNGDTDTLHRTASPALLAATPFSDYVRDDSALTSHELDVDGHWLAIGGVTGRGTAPGYYRAPVVAVDYLDLTPLDAQIADYRTSLLAVTAAAALIAAVFAWLLAGLIQRPVLGVARAARRFGTGDRTVRLPVHGRDAVADLADSFNTMAGELTATMATLEVSEARQRQFVADVSHELRTPMTALVAAAAALDDPATRDRAAVLVAPQLRRLAHLTDDLVETSLLDSGTVVLDREPVDLLALCRDAAEHSTAPEQVSVVGPGDAFADVDPRRIHTVLRNLVSNALRHGEGPVVVDVRGEQRTVVVTVTDRGPGLPADLGDAVFDRFVRGDRARTARAGLGSGLGLSLARENALIHGGTLTAADGPDGGARFTLTVPRAADTRSSDPRPAPVASLLTSVAPAPRGTPTTPADPAPLPDRSWRRAAVADPRRVAVAAGVVALVALAAVAAVVAGTGDDGRAPDAPVAAATPRPNSFQDLFGPDVPAAPLAVVASIDGPEDTTVDLVQGRGDAGLCTAVRVSTPSADPSPDGSCQPDDDGTALSTPVGTFGGTWTWISPTTGTSWSGWFGLGATAATVQLRLDNQPVGSATPEEGAFVLPAIQDTRAGCRTVVGLDPPGGAAQVFYLSAACDPSLGTSSSSP